MSYNDIAIIIKKESEKKGYTIVERPSVSTTSRYYKIISEYGSLLFRVADHKTKSNVITLRSDRKITPELVRNFINNRIKDLQQRHLKQLFGY